MLDFFFGLFILVAIFVFLLHRRTNRHFKHHEKNIGLIQTELRVLRDRLASLESQISWLGTVVGHPIKSPEDKAEPTPVPTEQTPKTETTTPQQARTAEKLKSKVREPVKPETTAPIGKPPETHVPFKSPSPRHMSPLEPSAMDVLIKQFLENWTGILGTIVLVAGIGFVGTYAALRLPAIGRFALVLAASVALFVSYLALRKRERWHDMALWLRSSAAAVFLFACAAAGGLPNVGLMWIENTSVALAVLLVGVALNLALSWSVCRQAFASLHVVLSLIPMAILPQVPMTLSIATVVSTFGVVLAYRHRWQLHLLITQLVYSVYHLYWVIEQTTTLPLPSIQAAFAVSSATVVFLGGVMVAYRRKSTVEPFNLQTVATHLVCWGFLATAFFIHLTDIRAYAGMILGAALLVIAFIAWGLSMYARRCQVVWLRTSDAITAQTFALASLASWHWQLDSPVMFLIIVYLETLLFLRLVIMDVGKLTARIGGLVVLGSAMLLLQEGFLAQQEIMTAVQMWQLAGVLFTGAFITTFSGAYFLRKFGPRIAELTDWQPLLITGPLSGLMIIVSLITLESQAILGTIALTAGAALLYVSHRLPGIGLAWGTWMVLIASNLFVWALSYHHYAGSMAQQLAQLTPVAVLTMLAIWRTPNERWQNNLRQIAIYFLGVHFGLGVFLLLTPTSALLPTVVWLIMSIIALEIAYRIKHTPTALPVLHLGYAYVIASAFGYVLVVMPTLTFLWNINLRLAIELYGVACLLYWWLARPGEYLANTKHWQRIQPYSLELTLLLIVSTVLLEVPLIWRPVAWMAFAFLFLAPMINRRCPRIAFYSLASFITSVIALTANVSIAAVPSPHWYHQPWPIGLVAIIIQLAYLLVAYHQLKLEHVRFQPELSRIDDLSRYLSANLAGTICYPFFAGLALFLGWRFEQAILTLLWASETFAIFVLSIVLKQNHFRLISLLGLAACLFRLLAYDMRETELFIRGLVFIGVGLLMLAMNAVYNKYGSRMENA